MNKQLSQHQLTILLKLKEGYKITYEAKKYKNGLIVCKEDIAPISISVQTLVALLRLGAIDTEDHLQSPTKSYHLTSRGRSFIP